MDGGARPLVASLYECRANEKRFPHLIVWLTLTAEDLFFTLIANANVATTATMIGRTTKIAT